MEEAGKKNREIEPATENMTMHMKLTRVQNTGNVNYTSQAPPPAAFPFVPLSFKRELITDL